MNDQKSLPERVREYMTAAPVVGGLTREVFDAYLAQSEILDGFVDHDAEGIHVDPKNHHISIVGQTHGGERRQVDLVDLGSCLSLWSGQGVNLPPELARSLGEALVAWADRKNPPPFDLMVTLTGHVLGDLNVDPYIDRLRLAIDGDAFKVAIDNGPWTAPMTEGVLIQKGHEIP